LVSKAGNFYLVVMPKNVMMPMFFGNKNGVWRHLSNYQVGPFLPPTYTPLNQGTDTEVKYRNYDLTNIRQINLNGEKYTVRLAA
jgi:hypothetical protein